MIPADDFRTGLLSIPHIDGDDLPSCCFRCVYLVTKEFSVSYQDGAFYYHCAYSLPDRLNQSVPPCLTPSGPQS